MADAAELQSQVLDLTDQAFETFAEDIATMFDTEVTSQQVDIENGTVENLKNQYKKLCAVCSVKSEGAVNGEFHVIFDKDGLFTLAGTFVMQPEQIIVQNRKSGTDQEAGEIGDALGEVGNLMVGAWDRVFREEFPGHGHFVQSGTYVGNPWKNTENTIRIPKDEELDILTFEMAVEPLPPFKCTAIYPSSLFQPSQEQPSSDDEPDTEEAAAEDTPAEEAATQTAETEASTEEPQAQAPEAETEPEPQAQAESGPESEPEPEAEAETEPEPEAGQEDTEEAEQPIVEENVPQEESYKQQEAPAGPVSEAISKLTHPQPAAVGGGSIEAYLQNEICAADIMRKDIAWATPEDTIEDMIAKMQQFDCGYLMIGNKGKLEGIVSKSDIRGAMSPYLQSMFIKWRSPMDIATLQIKAKWAMNRPVRTVRPDATIGTIMQAMNEHGGRCMPVVNEMGKVEGIVTVFDIFRILLSGGLKDSAGNCPTSVPLA